MADIKADPIAIGTGYVFEVDRVEITKRINNPFAKLTTEAVMQFTMRKFPIIIRDASRV
jgi:hypothetical protein